MNSIFVFGTNYRRAPVDWREQISFTREEISTALLALHTDLGQVAILATCNRLEIYAVVENVRHARQRLIRFLAETRGIAPVDIENFFYEHSDEAAVRHLFTVAAGLDSMLIGEAQILGQVRDAMQIAQQAETVGAILARLFQDALMTGKAARTKTEIGHGALSLGYAAVEQARLIFGDTQPRNVLVIGAGEMAESVARCLAANRIGPIIVANRTFERAHMLAEKFGGRAIHFGSIADTLNEVDIVIASSAAPHLVVPYADVARAMQARQRPLFLIDIAVPRDVDPRAAEIEGVHVYNIDGLRGVCDTNLAHRQCEADKARAIVEDAAKRFMQWLAEQVSTPTICALCQKAEELRQHEVARALKHLGDLSPEQRAEIDVLTQSIVRKILRDPVLHLKQPSNGYAQSEYLEIARALFDLKTN